MGDETVNLWRPGIPYQKWLMMQQDLITEEEKEAYRKQCQKQKAHPLARSAGKHKPTTADAQKLF